MVVVLGATVVEVTAAIFITADVIINVEESVESNAVGVVEVFTVVAKLALP